MHNDRKWVVHINRLKAAHGYEARESNSRKARKSRQRKDSAISHSSDELTEVQLGTRPLLKEDPQQRDATPNSPSSSTDPSPPQVRHAYVREIRSVLSPGKYSSSRREIQSTRDEPPLTRARTRLNAQEQTDIQCRYTYSW